MRIVIGSGSAPYVLVAGQLDSVEDAELAAQDLVQTNQYIRGASADQINRGGTVIRFSFGLTRTHASFYDAETFLLTHKSQIPQSGIITITVEDPISGHKSTLYLLNGTVSEATGKQDGRATIWRYVILAGQISTSPS